MDRWSNFSIEELQELLRGVNAACDPLIGSDLNDRLCMELGNAIRQAETREQHASPFRKPPMEPHP